MLKSKFASKEIFKATKIFTDRLDPRELFEASVLEFIEGGFDSRIIVYYGIGGIGKTELVAELQKPTYYPETKLKINRVNISLDLYDLSNPIVIMSHIRKQLGFECILYDYALLNYYQRIGMTSDETLKKVGKLNDSFFNILTDAISVGLGDVTVPIKYIKAIGDKFYSNKKLSYYKLDLQEIESLSDYELYERLPYYLGREIGSAYQKGIKTIVFMDAYESMLAKINNTAIREDSEEWLQELFISSENVLLVIGSREKIKWADKNPEWEDYLDQHILQRLSAEDSRYFLKEVPVKEEDIRNAIVTASNGVPLYLDMCVDLYSHNINNGKENKAADFIISTDKVIDRYLRHLNQQEKSATEILSYLDVFEEGFTRYLFDKYNISISRKEFDDFIDKSMFLTIENVYYKLDESVKQHILMEMDKKLDLEIIEALIYYLAEVVNVSDDSFILYFEQLLKMFSGLEYNKKYTENTIDIINKLIDYGLWNDLNRLIDIYGDNLLNHHPEIYSYAKMRYFRRRGMLKEGKELLETVEFQKEKLGKHKVFFRFLEIHFMHLLGEYDYALKKYKEAIDEYDLIKNVIHQDAFHMFIVKYADLLMLKGRFRESLDAIEKLLNTNRLSEKIQMEALRVKGHIYRFNYMFDKAEIVYKGILEMSGSKNLSAIGKVENNLLECKFYYEPELALEHGERSIEINESIGATIESGKSYTSCGHAYMLIEDYSRAKECIEKSLEVQKQNGYKSGYLFGIIAKAHLQKRHGVLDRELLSEIIEVSNDINVYKYLLLPLEGELKELEWSLSEEIQWLDEEVSLNGVKRFETMVRG